MSNFCYSQKRIKDTLIDKQIYRFVKHRFNGSIKCLSQDSIKKNGGFWIFYDRKGIEKWCGEYNKNGKKTGKWWYQRREIVFYEDGKKTGANGIGCKGGCDF